MGIFQPAIGYLSLPEVLEGPIFRWSMIVGGIRFPEAT